MRSIKYLIIIVKEATKSKFKKNYQEDMLTERKNKLWCQLKVIIGLFVNGIENSGS